MPTLIIILFIQAALCLHANAQVSSIPHEWRKIKVLSSNRADVERLYGKASQESYFVKYTDDRGSVYISYSKGDCRSSSSPMWNVPEWTVIEVGYTPWKKPPKLKELIKKQHESRFVSRPHGDTRGFTEYVDEKSGFKIVYDDDLKEVRNVILRPARGMSEKYNCDKVQHR